MTMMLEGASLESPVIARSPCLRCGSHMTLSRIEPEKPGYEHHVFACQRCGHVQSVVVEIQ